MNTVELKEVLTLRELDPNDLLLEAITYPINPREASKILDALSFCLPLQRYNLSHLKRVRRLPLENDQASIEFEDGGSYRFVLEVLLCPKQEFPYVSDEIKAKVLFPLKSLEVATLDATSLPPAGAGAKYFLRRVSEQVSTNDEEELLAFQRISHMAASYDDSGSKDFVSSEMSQREQWWPLTFRPSLDVRTRDAPGTTFWAQRGGTFLYRSNDASRCKRRGICETTLL